MSSLKKVCALESQPIAISRDQLLYKQVLAGLKRIPGVRSDDDKNAKKLAKWCGSTNTAVSKLFPEGITNGQVLADTILIITGVNITTTDSFGCEQFSLFPYKVSDTSISISDIQITPVLNSYISKSKYPRLDEFMTIVMESFPHTPQRELAQQALVTWNDEIQSIRVLSSGGTVNTKIKQLESLSTKEILNFAAELSALRVPQRSVWKKRYEESVAKLDAAIARRFDQAQEALTEIATLREVFPERLAEEVSRIQGNNFEGEFTCIQELKDALDRVERFAALLEGIDSDQLRPQDKSGISEFKYSTTLVMRGLTAQIEEGDKELRAALRENLMAFVETQAQSHYLTRTLLPGDWVEAEVCRRVELVLGLSPEPVEMDYDKEQFPLFESVMEGVFLDGVSLDDELIEEVMAHYKALLDKRALVVASRLFWGIQTLSVASAVAQVWDPIANAGRSILDAWGPKPDPLQTCRDIMEKDGCQPVPYAMSVTKPNARSCKDAMSTMTYVGLSPCNDGEVGFDEYYEKDVHGKDLLVFRGLDTRLLRESTTGGIANTRFKKGDVGTAIQMRHTQIGDMTYVRMNLALNNKGRAVFLDMGNSISWSYGEYGIQLPLDKLELVVGSESRSIEFDRFNGLLRPGQLITTTDRDLLLQVGAHVRSLISSN